MLLVKANELLESFERAFSWEDMCEHAQAIDEAIRGIGPVHRRLCETANNFVDQDFLDALPGKIDEAFASVGARFEQRRRRPVERQGRRSSSCRVGQLLIRHGSQTLMIRCRRR